MALKEKKTAKDDIRFNCIEVNEKIVIISTYLNQHSLLYVERYDMNVFKPMTNSQFFQFTSNYKSKKLKLVQHFFKVLGKALIYSIYNFVCYDKLFDFED